MMEMNSGGLVLSFPSDRELVMARVFNAPRELLFTAMTRPEHVRRWYGRRSDTMTVCEIDLRVGGRWRFAVQAEDGIEYAFSGVYKEIVPPERIVTLVELFLDANRKKRRALHSAAGSASLGRGTE